MRPLFAWATPHDRRHALAGGLVLFSLLCAHTMLEVARDSLFLSRLSARELPLTYLLIAVVATIATQVDARLLRPLDDRFTLSATLLTGAIGAMVFVPLFETQTRWVPYAYYVWTSSVASIAVAQFWRLLSGVFTVSSAKRLFPPIGAGGALGAMSGAGGAELAQRWVSPEGLLGFGAAVFVASALLPIILFPPPPRPGRATFRAPKERDPSRARRHYLQRLFVIIALTAATAVLVDFAFKSVVEERVAVDDLGTFFSRFHFGVNLFALVAQLVLAPFLLRRLGVARALLVLPVLLALGAVGVVLSGGAIAVVVLRGTDGGLRHSLNRSATELLYFPLSRKARKRFKTTIDTVGQRAGQMVGSVAVGLAAVVSVTPHEVAVGIVVSCVAWSLFVVSMRRGYVGLLVRNLRAGAIDTSVDIGELEIRSLESLAMSLNDDRDEQVIAALDLLGVRHRARIPALLLHHPSRAVVLRALELLTRSGRADVLAAARRLIAHDDEEIRAAAHGVVADGLSPDELRAAIESQVSGAERIPLLVASVGRDLDEDGEALREIEGLARQGDADVAVAIARAIRLRRHRSLVAVLHVLVPGSGSRLQCELARAFGVLADEGAIGTLIRWLAPRATRREARDALVAIGDPALDALLTALADVGLPRPLRIHLPRTVARFSEPRAPRALLDHLSREPDAWVRHKLLRALRSVEWVADPRTLDAQLRGPIESELLRAAEMLGQQVALRKSRAQDARRDTSAAELLEPILREKEEQALDRVVRLVALRHSDAVPAGIAYAVRSTDRRFRAESRELLSNVIDAPLGLALSTLLDDELSDEARLSQTLVALQRPANEDSSYVSLLRGMIDDDSEAVRCIAAHHAGELELSELEGALRTALRRAGHLSRGTVMSALEAVGGSA